MPAAAILSNSVDPGQMRHRVQLWMQPTGSDGQPQKDESGASKRKDADMMAGPTVWARIVQQSGPVRYATEQYVDRISHVVTIRYRADVVKGMQVRFAGKRYLVQYVLDVELRRMFLHLLSLEEGL